MLACMIAAAGRLQVVERPVPEHGAREVAIDIACGGICGSDVHYFHDCRAAQFRVGCSSCNGDCRGALLHAAVLASSPSVI